MANILKTIGRMVRGLLGIGDADREDPAVIAQRTLDAMRARLAEIRVCAGAAAAAEYRLERSLALERAALESTADPDQRAVHETRVADLEAQVRHAQSRTAEARAGLEAFREELRQASARMRDAQVSSRLAAMRSQAEKLAMNSRFEEGLAAIDGMERKADEASAEARALAELNEALRGESPHVERGEGDEHQ